MRCGLFVCAHPSAARREAPPYNTAVYSPQLLDHFEHPRNSGILSSPQVTVQVENPACGDIVKLTAVAESDVILDIRFQAKGCVPSMACASLLTELVRGKTMSQAAMVGRAEILRHLGPLPPASSHAVQLALDALAALLMQLQHGRAEATHPS